ncbi:MAG: agmatine deiminase family protein [Proteobacteria bacterium]|nr:agmatine deiminase family protein [Pseudomonadota bacterium]
MSTEVLKGFRMPAEWEAHSGTWLSWPHNKEDWPGKFEPIPFVFVEMVRLISQSEKVYLIVKDAKAKSQASKLCKLAGVDMKQVQFYIVPTDRGWMRDCGPIFVKKGKEMLALDFRFNAWAKYDNWKRDNKLAAFAAGSQKVKTVTPILKKNGKQIPVVLEGGSIDVNGQGAMLTTEECLLSKVQERNPGFTRKDYEQVFHDYLGITHTIWLGKGIHGDDTHGHVDDLARFVSKDTVVVVREDNKRDPNYQLLQDNIKRLAKARDARGRQLNIAELPMPSPVVYEGQPLPASYANFLITNKSVLVPVFNDKADTEALYLLSALFPKHDVVGIGARDLVWGLGTIHCLTQQQPQR